MADNTTLNSGTGGDVIASDDIAGVKHQRVKVEFGADGSATDVSSANPLPVVLTTSTGVDIGDVTVANGTGASSVPVQGGAATDAAVAGNPLLAGARASAAAPTDMSADGDAVPLWATLKGALNVADGGGTLSVDDGGGALTVDGTVAVSGTVTVDASGATVPVSNAGLTELAAAINGSSQLDVNIAASAATLTVASHAVTNAGTFAVQESGSHVQVDDAAFTPATSKVAMAGFTFDDVAPDSVNEGDGGAARMSANRNQYVQIRDNAGNERGLNIDANGEMQISGTRNALPVTDNGGNLSVDWAGTAPPIGAGTEATALRVTVATDSTGVLSVDDNGGSLTVDNGGTFAVQATMAAAASSPPKAEDSASANADVGIPAMAVQKATPANTAGTDGDYEFLQMSAGRLWTSSTIDSALPAGTNAIGKLAANSGVDIGDVDVASVIPGTGATNLGKAEDAAHTTGDVGVMALSVRKDTGAATAGTDGDYQPLITDSSGNLYVNVAAGGTSGTQYTEDAASAADPTGNALIMVRADTPSATTSTDGDNIAARGTNKGELYVKHIDAIPVTDNGGNISIDDGGNSITVDGSVTVSGTVTANPASGTIDTVTTVGTVSAFGVSTTGPMKKEDVASADGDAGMAMLAVRKATPANTSGTDGDYEFLQMSAGRLWASATIDAALPAGTNAIGKLAANSGVDIGDVDVTSIIPGTGATNLGKAEDAAHSSGDVGVMALAVRSAAPSERSAGPTDGDYEPLATNEVGAMWVSPTGSANGGLSTFMASGSDGSSILVATAQAIKASAGTMYGYFAYNPESAVTFVHFYNTAAASVTVGTTNPLFTLQIPPTSAANMSIPQGIAFSNAGWSCAATTTAGGNTAPATGVSLTVWYK